MSSSQSKKHKRPVSFVVLEDGRRFKLVHERRSNRNYLGSYNPRTKTIRIMTPRVMYQAVLEHEVRHAASPLMRAVSYLVNWKVLAFGQTILGMFLLFQIGFGLFGHGETLPMTYYVSGLAFGFSLLMIMTSVEEIRNRFQDQKKWYRNHAFWIEKEGHLNKP